jgi:hypothetical protein
MRARQVIVKLAEDAYFMRVDNRVAQPPPARNRDNEATSRSTDLGRNRTRAELLAQPNRTRATAGRPSQAGNSAAAAGGDREIIPHRDPGGGGSDDGRSNHGANRRAGGGGDRGGRGHANSHASGASQGGFDTRQKIEELRRKKSATVGDNDGFPAFSPRLCNLLLPEKFKALGITKYDAKQDPIQWLRCYALSIENAGGNNDTKCLYFPFCLDQAPLTWLESLEKHSIDKWDQLKDQFTINFAGAMGRSGTRMDLAMVKQEQGETLCKYMRRFFDKRDTVVDVTNKVIDLFQDGLYHRRTFEDFGRRRPRSITHLKDMITSWVDEEDKANAKYDAIRGKSKQNTGGGSSNNGNQGGRNNNNYSGPNRKRKPDNTVAAIQRPAKENPKKTSGGFKDLLKEKCPWHLDGNHTTEQCYQLRRALKDTPEPPHPHDKKGKKKNDKGNGDFQEPDKTVNVLFGALPSRQEQKATRREVMSIEPAVSTPLRSSEVPITFSHADQWTSFSEPGRFPLVLKPVVTGSRLNKVLIDGGSGLNVLFTKTLKK